MAKSPTYSMRWQKYRKEQEDEVMARDILRKNKVGGGVHWEPDTQREQITTLKEQLAKHGGHTADCWVNTLETPGEEHQCDCGWAEIEKGQGK